MPHRSATVRARAAATTILTHLDQVHPGMLPVVVLALVLVIGAAVVAAAAILAAVFVTSASAGLAVLARRAVHAATAYRGKPAH